MVDQGSTGLRERQRRTSVSIPIPVPSFAVISGWRDLQWRRRRFVISVVATSLVFAITLLLTGFLEHFDLEAKRTVGALGGDGFVVAAGVEGPFTGVSPLSTSVLDSIESDGGVVDSAPLIALIQVAEVDGPLDVYLIGHRVGDLGAPPVADGRAASSVGEAVVDRSMGLDVGERLRLGPHSFEIVGRTDGLTVIGSLPNVYLPLATAQEVVFGGADVATSAVVVGRPSDLPAGLKYVDQSTALDDLRRPLADTIESIELFRLLLWLVAAGIVGSVLYLSALERQRDFAVFKATGVATVDLVTGMGLQAVLLSLAASAMAIGLANLLAPTFPAGVSFPLTTTLMLPAVALLTGVLGSLAGVRRAVTVDPAYAFGGA